MAAGLLSLSALYFAVSRRRLSAEQSTAAEDGLREDMILSLFFLSARVSRTRQPFKLKPSNKNGNISSMIILCV